MWQMMALFYGPAPDRRRAISWIPTTGGIEGRDIRDLMVESVEHRFGLMNQLPEPIEVAVR